ncbi:MAG: glycosyltransferase [Acetomicrobium sp.]|nr:glycosyltransferase [Acetomicrobium sp.]
MRLFVHATNLVKGGALQVARSLLIEWSRSKDVHSLTIAASPQLASVLPSEIKTIVLSPKCTQPIAGLKTRKRLNELLKLSRADLAFTVFGPSPWTSTSVPHVTGFANPWLCQDISYALKKLSTVKRAAILPKIYYQKKITKLSPINHYIAETNFMARGITKLKPNATVYTVSNTISQTFIELNAAPIRIASLRRPCKQLDDFWVVTLSAYYPHKDLEIIPHVCRELKRHPSKANYKFFLSLDPSGSHWKKIHRIAENYGVSDMVYTVGEIPPQDAFQFYQGADLMFLPTLLESFSASYLEAMACRVPILTTKLPFAIDICKDAALYFEPLNAQDAARKILDLSLNQPLRAKLISLGETRLKTFPSPYQRAESYLEIFDYVINEYRTY